MNNGTSATEKGPNDPSGPVIEVGTIKEILLIEIKRTCNEFWREYSTLDSEVSKEHKVMILNEHIKSLTMWLKLDRE